MKITIEKTETIKTELDIQLPYYSRYLEIFYYKVISENLILKITNPFENNPVIELTEYLMEAPFKEGREKIDYFEFKEALITATQKIVNS